MAKGSFGIDLGKQWNATTVLRGAPLAVNPNNFYFKNFPCVNVVCKYFDATFWVSTKRHPNAMERVVGTPNKVLPPTLNTIPHLWYTFRL